MIYKILILSASLSAVSAVRRSVPDWEFELTKCAVPIIPDGLTWPDEPIYNGELYEVYCNDGYELVGDDLIFCGSGGELEAFVVPTDPLPICRQLPEPTKCAIPIIPDGQISPISTRSHLDDGERLEITCNSGYGLFGDQVIECENGSWSGFETPECRPDDEMSADCIMPHVYNGYFYLLADRLANPGSTLVLRCLKGYRVKDGIDKVLCVTGKYFDPLVLPECVPLEVPGCLPPDIEHAMIEPESGIRTGDTVSISCYDGYLLSGPDQISCEANGNYDDQPVCELPPKCPVPVVTDGQAYSLFDGEFYEVYCNDGYELVGDDLLFCGSGGELEAFWEPTDPIPICRKLPEACDIPQILNGWLTVQRDQLQIPYMEDVYVVCNQPHYRPTVTRVTCVGKNEWNPPIPKCTFQGPTCSFPTVNNGVVTPQLEEVLPWQSITVVCDEGYSMEGHSRLMCVSVYYSYDQAYHAVMDQPIPRCVRETHTTTTTTTDTTTDTTTSPTCSFPTVNNGVVTPQLEEIVPWQSITVVCDEGYLIEGSSRLQCLENGLLDQPMPQCVRKLGTGHCGQRVVNTDAIWRIYGGTDASPGEFPWNVLIKFTRGRMCGGSIISKEWVLTAGHCILHNIWKKCNNQETPGCRPMDPRDVIAISAGVLDREERVEHWQVRTAVEIVAHTHFTSQASYIDNDVALIKVNQPFEYNSMVNRVCLPKGVGALMGNPNLTVSGWGKTNTAITSNILQKTTVPYVNRETCNANISYDGIITETMFCAGYPAGKIDTCQGDAGGPLVYLGSNGSFVQGGIVSWGRGCAMPHFYGVYTNLAYFHDWIMSYILEN